MEKENIHLLARKGKTPGWLLNLVMVMIPIVMSSDQCISVNYEESTICPGRVSSGLQSARFFFYLGQVPEP